MFLSYRGFPPNQLHQRIVLASLSQHFDAPSGVRCVNDGSTCLCKVGTALLSAPIQAPPSVFVKTIVPFFEQRGSLLIAWSQR
jgi:hypothetical protein